MFTTNFKAEDKIVQMWSKKNVCFVKNASLRIPSNIIIHKVVRYKLT